VCRVVGWWDLLDVQTVAKELCGGNEGAGSCGTLIHGSEELVTCKDDERGGCSILILAWIGRSCTQCILMERVWRWNFGICFLVLICLQVTLYML
jgi:hypothetical protein